MDAATLLIPTLLLIVPGAVFALTVGDLRRARRSVRWPRVPAAIVDARVCSGSKMWRPQITYRYTLAGRHYAGSRIVVGWMWEVDHASAREVVARHAPGSTACVAVDPADPAYSVLTPGVRVHQIAGVVLSAFVLATTVALSLLFVALPQPKSLADPPPAAQAGPRTGAGAPR